MSLIYHHMLSNIVTSMAGNMQCKNSVKIWLVTWNIRTLNGKGLEKCEELWMRNVDLCCLQVVRWRGCGARLIGLLGRKYRLWWSGNKEGYGGVGVLVKKNCMIKSLKLEE